jgi:hypothetical protein
VPWSRAAQSSKVQRSGLWRLPEDRRHQRQQLPSRRISRMRCLMPVCLAKTIAPTLRVPAIITHSLRQTRLTGQGVHPAQQRPLQANSTRSESEWTSWTRRSCSTLSLSKPDDGSHAESVLHRQCLEPWRGGCPIASMDVDELYLTQTLALDNNGCNAGTTELDSAHIQQYAL